MPSKGKDATVGVGAKGGEDRYLDENPGGGGQGLVL